MRLYHLPSQTLGEIVSYLDIKGLIRLSQTSKHLLEGIFDEVSDSFDIWEYYCQKKGLRKPSNRAIESGTWKNILRDHSIKRKARNTLLYGRFYCKS
jgi:hypothetical protein